MPAYNFQVPPPALFPFPPQHTFLVFNNETVLVNEYSQQVQLPPGPTAGQRGIRVVIDFNAAPGNVEFDVVEADNDAAGAADYANVPSGGQLNQGALTAGPNGAGTRLITDLIPISGQFAALFTKTAPSNANIKATARISRAA